MISKFCGKQQTKLEFRFRILTLLSSGNLSVKEKVLFAATRFPHFDDAFVCVTKLAAVLTELHDTRAAGSRCDSSSLATPSKYYTFKKFWCTLERGRRSNYKQMLIKGSTWPWSRDRNEGRSHNTNIDSSASERAWRVQVIILTIQNSIQEEINIILKSGNTGYHSVQNLLYPSLLSKNLKVKIYRTIILPMCFVWVWNLVAHIEGLK